MRGGLGEAHEGIAFAAYRARVPIVPVGISGTPGAAEHRVRLFLNGQPVGEPSWSSTTLETVAVEFSPSLVQEGANTLVIENPGGFFPGQPVTYLSGAPLHVLALEIAVDSSAAAVVGLDGSAETLWKNWDYGLKISDAKRRGYSEKPAGAV